MEINKFTAEEDLFTEFDKIANEDNLWAQNRRAEIITQMDASLGRGIWDGYIAALDGDAALTLTAYAAWLAEAA